MKQLSIIIPHFNTHQSLKKLLETIPDKKELEIILIDDNSDEQVKRLRGIVNKIKEQKTKLTFKFYTNNSGVKGAGACRNIGLSHAEGKWILFADSDDYFEPNFYTKVSNYFQSTADMIIFTPISREYNTNNISDRHIARKKIINRYIQDNRKENLLKMKYEFPEPWSKLYKKEIIEKNNIKFQETIVANDVLFSARVGVVSEKVIASEEVIYCVVKRKGSLTTVLSDERFLIRVKVFIDFYNFLKRNLDYDSFKELNLSATLYILSMVVKGYSRETKKKVFIMLRKNNIKFFSTKSFIDYLNPIKRIRSYKHNKIFVNNL